MLEKLLPRGPIVLSHCALLLYFPSLKQFIIIFFCSEVKGLANEDIDS